ncbi:hypothetical protein ACIPY0_20340 [Paenarthrobacter nicotinovorans]|uniref:hypothetical protein n=1 Tax=Paenarthrobacter nicotinovorans TaxID=29320 RepID=UPI00380C6198
MSTERDELAKLAFVAGSPRSEADANADWTLLSERTLQPETRALAAQYRIAGAVLAAGYRKPRTVTTVEELVGLEDPTTILVDYTGHPYQWEIGMDGSEGWITTHDHAPITSHHLWRFAPLTVLREPTP